MTEELVPPQVGSTEDVMSIDRAIEIAGNHAKIWRDGNAPHQQLIAEAVERLVEYIRINKAFLVEARAIRDSARSAIRGVEKSEPGEASPGSEEIAVADTTIPTSVEAEVREEKQVPEPDTSSRLHRPPPTTIPASVGADEPIPAFLKRPAAEPAAELKSDKPAAEPTLSAVTVMTGDPEKIFNKKKR